jgi:hypothetical protein
MPGRLVLVIKVLVRTVLFDDEHLVSQTKDAVKLVV